MANHNHGPNVSRPMAPPPTINVSEARALAKSWAVFLDAESPDVWEAKNGAIRRLTPNAVPPFLRSLPKDAPIVVYSSHPKLDSSPLVANTFRQQGYTHVKALAAGATSWRGLGFDEGERRVFPSTW